MLNKAAEIVNFFWGGVPQFRSSAGPDAQQLALKSITKSIQCLSKRLINSELTLKLESHSDTSEVFQIQNLWQGG